MMVVVLSMVCLGALDTPPGVSGCQQMQYFRPGGQYFVGDCMPFFHEGVFHLFYLVDENHHQGCNGRGGHQWAHAETTDLVHWKHHPMAISITDDWEGSICTGSVFYYDGLYCGYYASRKMDGTEHMSVAVSRDGIHFDKTEPRIFASPEDPYIPGPFRDPCVFRDESTGIFHMLVTASLKDPALADRGGCLAHLTSNDLQQWKMEDPFLAPGLRGQPECSDHFFWNGWYYLIFSYDGVAQYRMSRNPLGPWTRPPVDTFDGPMARVMKTAEFNGGRRLGVAFLPSLKDDRDDGAWLYAGVTVFHEITQDAQGFLWSKFPEEIMPATGDPIPPEIAPLPSGTTGHGKQFHLAAPEVFNTVKITSCPADARISLQITPSPDSREFGICLRADEPYGSGYELRFMPVRQKAELHPCTLGGGDENAAHSIYQVTSLDKPFTVTIYMKDDIIDEAIKTQTQQRCLVNRFPQHRGKRMFLFGRNAGVIFDNLDICEIKNS